MRPNNNNLLRLARLRCRCALPSSTRFFIQRPPFHIVQLLTSSAICLDSKSVNPVTWATRREERNPELAGSAVETGPSQEQTDGGEESSEADEIPVLSLFTKGIEPTATVNVYFPGDRRRVSLVFDTKTSVEKAKKDFDDGVCKIHRREVQSSVVERERDGQLVWELVLDCIPVEILEQDIGAAIHGMHQPSAVAMDRKFADTEGCETYLHVQNALSRIGPVIGWDPEPHNEAWAARKAAVTFTNATNAAAAVETLRNKPITMGTHNIEVTPKRVYSLKFRIPATLENDVGRHIESKFHATWRKQSIQSQWLRHEGGRTLKIWSEDVSTLQTIRDEMVALVEGDSTVVRTTDGKVLWSNEFDSKHQVTRQPVMMKLKMIEQALGVTFFRDKAARRLIAFGPELQRKHASELACTAAMVNHEAVDPRTAHHWQRLDLQEFKSTLQQYLRNNEGLLKQPALTKTEETPLFRKVINVPSHVASSSREDLEKLQKAVGRDPKRPLRLFSPDPPTKDQEPPTFRKHVPELSDYAKAFLDARLNPRYISSDKTRDLGEPEGAGTLPKETPVPNQPTQPQPPASKEHAPNPEGLKKLDELLNAMRNPPASSIRQRSPPPLNQIHTPRPNLPAAAQPRGPARGVEQEDSEPDPEAVRKLDKVLNAMKRDV